MTRALIIVRLSKVEEGSTSLSAADLRARCERYAEDHGWTVVAVAEDLSISGEADPFLRPSLKPWLARHDEYDVLLCTTMDRLTRGGGYPWGKVKEWADANDVQVVFTDESSDETTLDIKATLARDELNRIKDRNTRGFNRNIKAGRYRGGNPPLGYRAEKVDQAGAERLHKAGISGAVSGEWRYIPDPVMAELARDIIARVIGGEPVARIVKDLNDRGVTTPQNHFRIQAGKEPKPYRWAVGNLIRQLESETLLGYAMRSERVIGKNGKVKTEKDKLGRPRPVLGPKKVIRNPDGSPLVRSEPIIDRGTFDRLQEALSKRRGASPKRRKNSTALLLQVIYCAICDRPMYRMLNNATRKRKDGTVAPHNRDYYRCASAVYQSPCGNRSVRTEVADKLVTDDLLDLLSDLPRVEKVYEPGEDHAVELADIDAQLVDIAETIGTPGFTKGTPGREKLEERQAALAARREKLANLESRPAGYRWVSLGHTFGDYWAQLDNDGRNQWLRNVGVQVKHKPDEWHFTYGDIPEMIAAVNAEIGEKITPEMGYRELRALITGQPPEPLPWERQDAP